ncbi:fluoride efflux transporter CrcB [Mycolicibacterium chlorophenolicum]|uniref:Fluoride-specific ion channel FluC n=1 Tax=Mycolicibacterium chlorophenolicum TaxID=37916 RepID=A0A0J6WLE8_9MYCO|nr:fluoride efflux transporter CrcB [Mycolicibacterium chlorophenolicum]KMO82512.1 putative fluoride ion transporter CrcB [Mycolicibacterium chlorophenolicum]
MTVVAVMLAGASGALARFLIDSAVKHRWRVSFPWATVVLNVTGSLLLGFLAGAVIFDGAPGSLQQVAGTGFCGGYTTFSTASFETVRLAEQRRSTRAFANALGSLVASVAACVGGLVLAWSLS